jgi:hypothetical protein
MSWLKDFWKYLGELTPAANLVTIATAFGALLTAITAIFVWSVGWEDIAILLVCGAQILYLWWLFSRSRLWNLRRWTCKRRVRPYDLQEIYENLGQRFYRGDVAPQEVVEKWFHINKDIAWRIDEIKENRARELMGVFFLIPLTKEAIEELEKGQLDNAKSIEPSKHISPHNSSAYYIAAFEAVSKDRRFEFVTMHKLFEHLRDLAQDSDLTLYRRPSTPRGVRLVKAYSFEKLQSDKEGSATVWKKVLPKNADFCCIERIYRQVI